MENASKRLFFVTSEGTETACSPAAAPVIALRENSVWNFFYHTMPDKPFWRATGWTRISSLWPWRSGLAPLQPDANQIEQQRQHQQDQQDDGDQRCDRVVCSFIAWATPVRASPFSGAAG